MGKFIANKRGELPRWAMLSPREGAILAGE
jgi:hypothetical protein